MNEAKEIFITIDGKRHKVKEGVIAFSCNGKNCEAKNLCVAGKGSVESIVALASTSLVNSLKVVPLSEAQKFELLEIVIEQIKSEIIGKNSQN